MSTAEAASQSQEIALARLPGLEAVGAAFALPAGSIHINGLQLTDSDMKFEEWQEIGHRIGSFGRWHRFALGDWILFGEALYGEDAAQAVESTPSERYDVAMRVSGLQLETLKNYVRICQAVPLPIRRVELDFSIHEAVAALEREDQIYWLGQAVEQGYDRASLRQAIKDSKNPPADDGDTTTLPPADPPLTRAEMLQEAAAAVYHSWQPTSDGSYIVPPEPAARLMAALGEE